MADGNEKTNGGGPERRRSERRRSGDRRDMVRFEPEKLPRRSGIDRRKSTDPWKNRDL